MVIAAPWYFSHLPDGTIRIIHMSGFGFNNAPRPDGSPVFDCVLDGDTSTSPTFRALERAATFVAKHANLIVATRGHKGAIYFDYTQPVGWVEHLRNPSPCCAPLWPLSGISAVIPDIACPIPGMVVCEDDGFRKALNPSCGTALHPRLRRLICPTGAVRDLL
jgi:hypothetical protein